MTEPHVDAPTTSDSFERRLHERVLLRSNPLETIPDLNAGQPHGSIPNTPLAVSTISFLLGSIFAIGFLTFLSRGFDDFWFATYQLGFFVAAWSAFHWGEFAVTAGWNRQKVSVDCMNFYYRFLYLGG
jgi:protein-S-isoprenylcysteine O-methyltransferase